MSSIGIFDSGFGGLSIMKEIVKVLPKYNYVYLGDNARTPYGNRSQETIYNFTREGVEFLFNEGCDLVILACNSASAEALHRIQTNDLKGKWKNKKVLGVLIPAAEEAVAKSKTHRIGVLGTVATCTSGAFKREINKLQKDAQVFQVPAPLLVPLVEAGEHKSKSAEMLVGKYTKNVLSKKIDTLILGCTHYGFFEKLIKKNAQGVHVVSEGRIVGEKLKDYLSRHKEVRRKLSWRRKRIFFTTDDPHVFDELGKRFYAKEIKSRKATRNNPTTLAPPSQLETS